MDNKQSKLQQMEGELGSQSREIGLLNATVTEKDETIRNLNNHNMDSDLRQQLLRKDLDLLQVSDDGS